MFEFNIAEAFVRVVLNAIKENNENIKFGAKWTEFNEGLGLIEIKITINYNLVKFVAVRQTLSVFVGDNGEKKVEIKEDDNEFDIAVKIIAALD